MASDYEASAPTNLAAAGLECPRKGSDVGCRLMRNVDPVFRQWLAGIEIYTIEDLQRVGAASAWLQVKDCHPDEVITNLLWALVGAEFDMDWRQIPLELKGKALATVNGSAGIIPLKGWAIKERIVWPDLQKIDTN